MNKLPLPGHRAAFEVAIAGVLKKMETLITYLGTNPPPQDFQSEKQKLINVLDVIPSVATTLNFQLAALEQVARVADLSVRLIDLALGVKSVAAKEQIGSLLMEGITLPSLILLTAIPKKPQQ